MELIDKKNNLFFATPFFQGKFKESAELNKQLKQFFLQHEKTNIGNKTPKNTTLGNVYDSEADLFNWPNESVQKLKQMMHGVMSSWIKDVNNFSPAEFSKLRFRYESWFHITRKGGCKTLHNHGSFSWSMVYYVDEGGAAPTEFPRSGMLQFYDPRRIYQNGWDIGLDGLGPQSRAGGFAVRAEAGGFVIFPGYVDHEVLTYHGEKERIMVAINCAVISPDSNMEQ